MFDKSLSFPILQKRSVEPSLGDVEVVAHISGLISYELIENHPKESPAIISLVFSISEVIFSLRNQPMTNFLTINQTVNVSDLLTLLTFNCAD